MKTMKKSIHPRMFKIIRISSFAFIDIHFVLSVSSVFDVFDVIHENSHIHEQSKIEHFRMGMTDHESSNLDPFRNEHSSTFIDVDEYSFYDVVNVHGSIL